MKKFTLLASLLMFVAMSYAVNVVPVEERPKTSFPSVLAPQKPASWNWFW